jgi:pyruvate kinase
MYSSVAYGPSCVITYLNITVDTKGPEIRTGKVDPAGGDKVKYSKGDVIEVGTDYTRPCTSTYLACSYKSLPKSVKVGSKMLVADGSLVLEVTEVGTESVHALVKNNASFGSMKNMNLPGAVVDLPTLTERDINDLQNFGVAHQVDFIAASFVRKGSDIDFIREVLGERGAGIKIIAKIENQEGMENFDEILEKTDGIMVARGDLGMEIPLEKVFLAQKMMIRKCNVAGKPVVTATQMLESMIQNPRPTRAECADVANAILDGSDAVMLSGETANGEFPIEAVTTMANTCVEAESMIDYDAQFNFIRHKSLSSGAPLLVTESIASSAVKTARELSSPLIVVITQTGTAARMVAKYRPSVPVLAVTADRSVARQCAGYIRNCSSWVVPVLDAFDGAVRSALDHALSRGLCKTGDTVVVVQGNLDNTPNATNLLRLYLA